MPLGSTVSSCGALDEIIHRLVNSDDVDKEIREYSEAAAEQVTKASRTVISPHRGNRLLSGEQRSSRVCIQGPARLFAVNICYRGNPDAPPWPYTSLH